ncbi:hypothetical protein SUSAZ_10340 [Sulfolobus acidocaldarius SUSAZ]|nr:hypothetical protein SUSAZ_10340 [Sulfolobus acidocaldarius SUSAZ]
MVRLIATLGKTVGGPIETFENLVNANYISAFPSHKVDINEVIVITTKETEETFYVLKSVFLCCANFTKVREVTLPFDDITAPDDFITIREKVREVLRAGDYLDFSGGRKAISAAAALAAREIGAHLVTSIIDEDEYDKIRKRYYEIKDKALSIYNKGQCISYLCDLYISKARTIVLF